jgi:chromate transporter
MSDRTHVPAGGTAASMGKIAKEWTRIGLTGFGGPPAHIALLRHLVVDREGWIDAREFQDANAASGLLPGPASTQLAIFCAYRVGGIRGAIIGGLGFVAPAVVLILALSVLFLAQAPPIWVRGAGAGAGAAVPAVAVLAARALLGPSFARVREHRSRSARWLGYLVAGGSAAVVIGPELVLVLVACGLLELIIQRARGGQLTASWAPLAALVHRGVSGGTAALVWTAFKVGALSFGGGFVIVPLMQGDAVHTYHWMTNAQFLNAVALGQITPGPVVATVAAVGYAAHGLAGGLLAAAVAFAPSFSLILLGARRFERLRRNIDARSFLDGAGPAAIGAILGAAITLAGALSEPWQFGTLAIGATLLLVLHQGIVTTILLAAGAGVLIALAGAPLPH